MMADIKTIASILWLRYVIWHAERKEAMAKRILEAGSRELERLYRVHSEAISDVRSKRWAARKHASRARAHVIATQTELDKLIKKETQNGTDTATRA